MCPFITCRNAMESLKNIACASRSPTPDTSIKIPSSLFEALCLQGSLQAFHLSTSQNHPCIFDVRIIFRRYVERIDRYYKRCSTTSPNMGTGRHEKTSPDHSKSQWPTNTRCFSKNLFTSGVNFESGESICPSSQRNRAWQGLQLLPLPCTQEQFVKRALESAAVDGG